MTNKQKVKNFFLEFEKKYPKYEIVEFKNLGSQILIKDPEGFIHKKTSAHQALNYVIGVQSAIDKVGYIQNKITKLNLNLTLLEYGGTNKKCIVQDIHGFTYSPATYDLLQGHPPTIQTCNEKELLYIHKANTIHKHRYEYPEFRYTNGKQKIEIICREHGSFYQTCESHLYGTGCPKCANDLASYDKSRWIDRYKTKVCTFYVLEVYNDVEEFIKIGVTSKKVSSRYNANTLNGYNYREVVAIKGTSQEVMDLESHFLTYLKEYRYDPQRNFQGRTECFKPTVKQLIYEQFKK